MLWTWLKEPMYTANEGLVRIQYKCLIPIYVFPEIKLHNLIISNTNYNVLSPNVNMHRYINVGTMNEGAQFPFWEYTN